MNTPISEKIHALNSVLLEKQVALEQRRKESNGKWKLPPTIPFKERTINIRVIADKTTLLKTFSEIMVDKKNYHDAAEVLGIDVEPYSLGVHAYDDVIHDFKIAAAKIEIRQHEASIRRIQEIINQYTPEEIKREQAFNEVDSLLQSIP